MTAETSLGEWIIILGAIAFVMGLYSLAVGK